MYNMRINRINKKPTSNIITEYSLCEKFKTLLEPGGLNDQNPFWLSCMDIINTEISNYHNTL